MTENSPTCGCLGCREPAAIVIKHDQHGTRTVCETHATGQVVLADV